MLKLLSQIDYNRAAIKQQLAPLLDECSLQQATADRSSVLLKPNFVMPAPRQDASTTHPEFYMAVAELLLERGFTVGIGESPAFGSCTSALHAHDVLEECRDRNIAVVEFKNTETYRGVADEKHYQTLTIARELNDWDAIINLPKLKVHQQFTFTAATKNLYGCVTGKRKFIRHNVCGNNPVRFARMILANAKKAACILHIGDGIQAMHIKGPRGGAAYPLGKIIVADTYLNHDWLFCHLTGLNPLQTPLFQAIDNYTLNQIQQDCSKIINAVDFYVAVDFIHAELINISFNPWHMVRSGWRTLHHSLT